MHVIRAYICVNSSLFRVVRNIGNTRRHIELRSSSVDYRVVLQLILVEIIFW